MKIETDDWIPLCDAWPQVGLAQATAYRIAKRLKLVHEFFGVKVIKRSDIQKLADGKMEGIGNPNWIASGEQAAKAAKQSVASRLKRIARDGMTEAELTRGDAVRAGWERRREELARAEKRASRS